MLSQCNLLRMQYGLSPLTWDQEARDVSYPHCLDLANGAHYDHTGIQARVAQLSYKVSSYAENLAKSNSTDANDAVQQWFSSKTKMDNILGNFTAAGVARECNDYTCFYTMLLVNKI